MRGSTTIKDFHYMLYIIGLLLYLSKTKCTNWQHLLFRYGLLLHLRFMGLKSNLGE